MDTLDGGHYILAGDDTTNLGDNDLAFLRNARIGFVFQAFNLLSQLSSR
jgi:putative ABC transport system ATP-binding protein